MSNPITVEAECHSCQATGLYRGFAEPKGIGVVCLTCSGTGKMNITYKPFLARLIRTDITTVALSKGQFIFAKVGPSGIQNISYGDFLDGKMPK